MVLLHIGMMMFVTLFTMLQLEELLLSPLKIMRRASPNMDKRIAIRAADEALQNVGVTETEKDNHGPAIKIYLQTVALPEGYAWCAAFLKYRFLNAAGDLNLDISDGIKNLSGYTPDWSAYAKKHDIWISLEEAKQNPDAIKKGYVALFYSQSKDRIYHCGIVISCKKTGPLLVEGNTSGGPGVDANGGGIYLKTRSWTNLGKFGGFMKTY
jgi:hypothetical protein